MEKVGYNELHNINRKERIKEKKVIILTLFNDGLLLTCHSYLPINMIK
jgi:hypothetical protein